MAILEPPARAPIEPIYDAAQLPNRRKWTRQSYTCAWQSGAFGETKVELLDGEIIDKAPRTPQRATAIMLLQDALWPIVACGYTLRIQMPFVVSDTSEPEPDALLARGNARDFGDEHPTRAALTAQVAIDTLASDLGVKAALYAQANVPEYWVIDIPSRLVHVHRAPVHSDALPGGHGYQTVSRLTPTDEVSPLAAPHTSISIADLLL